MVPIVPVHIPRSLPPQRPAVLIPRHRQSRSGGSVPAEKAACLTAQQTDHGDHRHDEKQGIEQLRRIGVRPRSSGKSGS